jgi:hypothetical protein
MVAPSDPGRPSPTRGPLIVHARNPRYFADSSGRAVLLAGSHTWATLQEAGPVDPPEPFDWDGWVEFIDLTGAEGAFAVEWHHPVEGRSIKGEDITGGGITRLRKPDHQRWVVRVWR